MGHAPWSDWIDDLVSDELPDEKRLELERHLETCESCTAELAALRALRAATLGLAGSVDAPPGLEGGIRSAMGGPSGGRALGRRGALVAAAIAIAAALAVAFMLVPRSSGLPRHALSSYEAYRQGRLPLAIRTSDRSVLERFFGELLDFPVRVIDLRMMGLEIAGGRVRDADGRPSALVAYEGGGSVVLCQMLSGNLTELPSPDDAHEDRGFSFRVYRDGPRSAVFWQEGTVLCVLVSEAPWAEVLELARRKAMV